MNGILDQVVTDQFSAYHGDCVEVMRQLPARSIGYSIFSPPFASLYTYSNSPRDIGNVRDYAEFAEHFDHVVAGLARVMAPGRNVSVHCMDLPTSKAHHGFIGLFDFRGELIRAFQKHGFVFHSTAVIWKDPVTAMQRTKALGLLHKTLRENGTMSRQGVPDYLVTFRAPGETEHRVKHDPDAYPVSLWQQWASPVWTDIDPSDTLQYQSAREHDDERHICPLQLEVIRRGIELWSNPDDVVFSPFGGIGSEGYVALGGETRSKARVAKPRRAIIAELKESYFKQAKRNLTAATKCGQQKIAFADAAPAGAEEAVL